MKIKAGIIGATGYAGVELARILLMHSEVELSAISSVSFEGKPICEVYGAFNNILTDILTTEEAVIAKCDVVFASLPHGLCEKIAKACMEKGSVFIDLGADFRLENEADYQKWYNLDYNEKDLHKNAVYALPELFADKIAQSRLIANPGCYPTSVALALAPLLINNLIRLEDIIIDSKSGTTGAGRGFAMNTHFPECNENFAPYKIAQHRHTPEIEQTLSHLSKTDIKVTFVPHLLPVNRGILSTIYTKPKAVITEEKLFAAYDSFYKNKKFVRVLPLGDTACIRNVKYSNYCDISLHIDWRTNKIIVVSAIDNMVKGAAGQAIQNMNLVFGFKEDAGLNMIPPSF